MSDQTDGAWFWAIVTSVNPIRVRREGATVQVTPSAILADPATLAVNNRVWCQLLNKLLIVHGKAH